MQGVVSSRVGKKKLTTLTMTMHTPVTYLKLFWALDNKPLLLVEAARFCCWVGSTDWDWEDCEGIWSILERASLKISLTAFTSSIFRSTRELAQFAFSSFSSPGITRLSQKMKKSNTTSWRSTRRVEEQEDDKTRQQNETKSWHYDTTSWKELKN